MSPARNVPSIVHDLMGRREGKDRKGARGEGGMEGGGRRERGERGGERGRKEGGMEGGGGREGKSNLEQCCTTLTPVNVHHTQ